MKLFRKSTPEPEPELEPEVEVILGTIRFTGSGEVFPINEIYLEHGKTAYTGALKAKNLIVAIGGLPVSLSLGEEYGIYDPEGNLVSLGWASSQSLTLSHPDDSVDVTIHTLTTHGRHTNEWLEHHGF